MTANGRSAWIFSELDVNAVSHTAHTPSVTRNDGCSHNDLAAVRVVVESAWSGLSGPPLVVILPPPVIPSRTIRTSLPPYAREGPPGQGAADPPRLGGMVIVPPFAQSWSTLSSVCRALSSCPTPETSVLPIAFM